MINSFTATVIKGSGRGKSLGTPTINLDLSQVPKDLQEGIYACWARMNGTWHPGAMHLGPRPVFKDIPSCEVYILDTVVDATPHTLDIQVITYLRPVLNFPGPTELLAQIEDDVQRTRAILKTHGPPASKKAESPHPRSVPLPSSLA